MHVCTEAKRAKTFGILLQHLPVLAQGLILDEYFA